MNKLFQLQLSYFLWFIKAVSSQLVEDLGQPSCKPKDDDKCLQNEWGWNVKHARYWVCNDLSVAGEYQHYCNIYPKDAKRCCPVSCKNKKPFNKFVCESTTGQGDCIYPNGAQCIEDECGYKNLTYLAKIEGNQLRNLPFVFMPNRSSDELKWCVKQCDKMNGCRSIGFCPYSCYLYDKLIVGGEARGEDKGCYTIYQSCSAKINITDTSSTQPIPQTTTSGFLTVSDEEIMTSKTVNTSSGGYDQATLSITAPLSTTKIMPHHDIGPQEELQNAENDCWSQCNSKEGPCKWCGTKGHCVTVKDIWTNRSNNCGGTSHGLKSKHICVHKNVAPIVTRIDEPFVDCLTGHNCPGGNTLMDCKNGCCVRRIEEPRISSSRKRVPNKKTALIILVVAIFLKN